MVHQFTNLGSVHEDAGSSLALLSGLRIWHCRELRCRSQMWPGSSIAVAVAVAEAAAPIGPLAWKLPYVFRSGPKKSKINK